MSTASKTPAAIVISSSPEDMQLVISCNPAPATWPTGAHGKLITKRIDGGIGEVIEADLLGMSFPLSGVTPAVAAKVMQDIANYLRSTTGGYA